MKWRGETGGLDLLVTSNPKTPIQTDMVNEGSWDHVRPKPQKQGYAGSRRHNGPFSHQHQSHPCTGSRTTVLAQ